MEATRGSKCCYIGLEANHYSTFSGIGQNGFAAANIQS